MLRGKNGVVKVGNATVANVTSFSVSFEVEQLETTSMRADTVGRTYIDGLRSMSGTVELNLDVTDATGQMLFEEGDTIDLTLEVVPGVNYVESPVMVTNINIEASVGDLITASVDFVSNNLTGYTKTAMFGNNIAND